MLILLYPLMWFHLLKIAGSEDTSEEIINEALNIYKKANYAAILVKKETEGFVLNRLQGALLNEAVRLHEGGFASMEDIDVALKHALGIRWAFMGPFEIMDLNAPEGIQRILLVDIELVYKILPNNKILFHHIQMSI